MTDTTHSDDPTEADSEPTTDGGRVYHEPPETAPISDRPLLERARAAVPSGPRALRYAIAIGVALLWLVPLIGLFMASVRPLDQIIQGWWNFETVTVTFENYARAWTFQSGPMRQAMLNTAIVTIPSVLAVTLLGTMVAYPFARFDFPLKTGLFFLLIVVMAAPPELVAMGNYNTLRQTGLFDTYMGLILVHIGWGMGGVGMFLR
ncbi:ABC transporter permease, partial [Halorubrum sp. E3]